MGSTPKKKRDSVTRRAFLQTLGGGAVGAGVATGALGSLPLSGQTASGEMEVLSRKRISLSVNGRKVTVMAEARETLLQVLRDRLRMTGTKRTCNRGECGGCTVILNGKPVYSCHLLALQAEGAEVLTVEGLAKGEALHPVQQAFIDKDGYQCGFCTPGFVMASVALLNKNNKPTIDEIRAGLSGNICRCGNYRKIFEAVSSAAEAMRRG